MSRFRRSLARALRPLAMVGTVGILSLSMIGAQPAYAADTLMDTKRDAKAFEAIIKANYKTIAPAANLAMKAGSFTPVGRLLSLGFMAYSTSEIWMPVVAGAFGQSTGDNADKPADEGPYVTASLNLMLKIPKFETVNGYPAATVQFDYSGTSGTGASYRISHRLQCKRVDGSLYTTGTYSSIRPSTTARVGTVSVPCTATSDVALGSVFGTANGAPELGGAQFAGPGNVTRNGSFLTGAPGFNPYGEDVKYKVRSECIAPDGTISTVEAESSGDYMQIPSCGAQGKGHGTGKTSVVGLAPGTITETPIWDTPRAPSDPATPLCDASRPTDGCTLSVELDGKTCTADSVECQNWAEVNQADPNKDTEASRMKCRFGPYKLSMASCNALEKAYVGGQIWSDENTDGDPATGGAPKTAPSGSPIAAPAPTTTAPGVGTIPGTGGQPSPDASQQQKNCFPSGWAMFNPVEWVMKPVGCALEAAFVPKPEVVTAQTTRLDNKIKNVGFQRISTAWLSTFEAAGGGSGCSGPTVNFSMNGVSQSMQPFQACTQPMATVAGVAYAVSAIAIVLFGGLGMIRAIGAGFGFNFTMGKGGDSE